MPDYHRPQRVCMLPDRPTILIAILSLATCVLTLSAADWQALSENNPFGDAPSSIKTDDTPTEQLEFRGVVWEGVSCLVNVYDGASKTSRWLPVPGRDGLLAVSAYEQKTNTLTGINAGRTFSLNLKQAKVTVQAAAPLPSNLTPITSANVNLLGSTQPVLTTAAPNNNAAVPLPLGVPAATTPEPSTETASPNTTPAAAPEQSERMRQVLTEIRRRRLMRQQVSPQTAVGTAGTNRNTPQAANTTSQ